MAITESSSGIRITVGSHAIVEDKAAQAIQLRRKQGAGGKRSGRAVA